MTVQENIVKKSMVLMVEDGLKADGSAKFKGRTYGNVKTEAKAEDVLAVGNALGGLMQDTMHNVVVVQKTELEEM